MPALFDMRIDGEVKMTDRKENLEKFLRDQHLTVKDMELVDLAFTHSSYGFERNHCKGADNQRLEFLGDAVLSVIVAEYLFRKFPCLPEGELTRMRAGIVCEGSLAATASRLGIGCILLMGVGEKMQKGAERASNLADALEAYIGALYFFLEREKLKEYVLDILEPEIRRIESGDYGDYKTEIQEVAQQNGWKIEYRVLGESGPDHCKEFCCGIFINGQHRGSGCGRSKKEAEQAAAGRALNGYRGSGK